MASKRLIRLPEVETKTRYRRSTIYRLAQEGKFPTPVLLGARASAWIEDEIDAWIEGRIEASRTAAAQEG
jgi:prophage regulatory protein